MRPRSALRLRCLLSDPRSLPPVAAILLAVALTTTPAIAQVESGTQGSATPASESQHENVEEPLEPAGENPVLPRGQEALAQKIFNELISPCCWTTTVAQHGSGAAPKIQAEVRGMIAEGMGHEAILDHYVSQYGERILASPRKKGFNLAVYLVPPLGLALGALFIATAYRRRAGKASPSRSTGTSAGAGLPPAVRSSGTTVPGSEEDYRRRVEEEIRRSS